MIREGSYDLETIMLNHYELHLWPKKSTVNGALVSSFGDKIIKALSILDNNIGILQTSKQYRHFLQQ